MSSLKLGGCHGSSHIAIAGSSTDGQTDNSWDKAWISDFHSFNLRLHILLLAAFALLFVRGGKYRPIEGYIRNSTLLGCTRIYVRGVLEAAIMCHNDDVCGAIYRSEEKSGERGIAICKCVAESIDTTPVHDDSNIYLKMNDVFNTGRIWISKDYTYFRYSTPSTTDLSTH